MTINWKSKIILAKIEANYGVDPTPTGAANAMLMTQVSFSPMEGEDVSRDLEFPYLAAQGKIPVGLRCRLRGRVELVGSGTAGVAPAWGPLARACRAAEVIVADTSTTYNPISESMESVTIWFWIGGTKQIVKGCRGNATLRFPAQAIPYIELDVVGLYADPAEVMRPSVTLTGFQKPVIVTNANTPTFTIDDVPLVLREFMMNLGNQVEPRLLVGSDAIVIPDGMESVTARVEAVPMSTFNPFSLARTKEAVEVVLVHGTEAGKIATVTIPTAEIDRMGDYENAQNILEWNLPITPIPASGNDQWSLALT